jgi:hypothetical protein
MKIFELKQLPRFSVSSQSNFERSFKLLLSDNGATVGSYSYVVDDEGATHGVDIVAGMQGKGYGQMLTLKAIQLANTYELGYEFDRLGQTKQMDQVYAALHRKGLVTGGLTLVLTNDGEDALAEFEGNNALLA